MNILELVMIVKNSGDVLRKCLSSVKKYINKWTILDTGSNDNGLTEKIIFEELKGIKGNLYKEAFIDFSTSRNRSLDLSDKDCKYQLILDDSYELYGGDELVDKLKRENKDFYLLKLGKLKDTNLIEEYYSLRIVKTKKQLRYVGRVHEFIFTDNKVKGDCIKDKNIFVNDIESTDHFIRSKNRYIKDIDLLLQDKRDNINIERTMPKVNEEYLFSSYYERLLIRYSELEELSDDEFKRELQIINKKFPMRIEPLFKIAALLYLNNDIIVLSKVLDKLIAFPEYITYLTLSETSIRNYYIPYMYIDVNIKIGNINKAVTRLKKMLELYPNDRPLLNIKYAICDPPNNIPKRIGNKKILVIHCGDTFKWCPLTFTSNGGEISGSEFMVANMGVEFSKVGYNVFIFGNFVKDKFVDKNSINYFDFNYFDDFITQYKTDILIVSRFCANLTYHDNIDKIYLWVHDTLPFLDRNSLLLQTHPVKFKGIISLTNWHKQYIVKKLGVPESMVHVIGNAIKTERFLNKQVEKIPYRFIYTADYSRGLRHLLDIIPLIKERYKETVLEIFTNKKHIPDESLEFIERNKDYIHLNDKVSQDQIALEFLKSDVWLYPTDFKETYCITAVEAQISKCLVVTVNLAGLIDTVGDRGVTVNPPITDEKVKNELLKKLYFCLNNKDIKNNYLDKAYEWSVKQDFSSLVSKFQKLFE